MSLVITLPWVTPLKLPLDLVLEPDLAWLLNASESGLIMALRVDFYLDLVNLKVPEVGGDTNDLIFSLL